MAAMLESPYTRYPVYRESLDEIVGILHVRDLVASLHNGIGGTVALAELLRPPYIVPETKDLGALLAEFRRTNQHMAVVVDEYGATAGIVTLEDLLEEIVGEIEDEFDLPDESVERRRRDGRSASTGRSRSTTSTSSSGRARHEDFHTVAGLRLRPPRPCCGVGRRGRSTTGSTSPCSRRAARGSSASRSSSCADRERPTRTDRSRVAALASLARRRSAATRLSATATSPCTWARWSRRASRSRCRSSRSAGRSTRSTASRSTSGSSASRCSSRCRCSPCPPATSPTGTRDARCSRWRRARRRRRGRPAAVTLSGADPDWPFFALAFVTGSRPRSARRPAAR